MTFDKQSSTEERQALEFLKRGRKLRGLSGAQLRRIERRLEASARPHGRRLLRPVLVALGLVLVAGSAAGRMADLSRLPLIGPLFPLAKPTSVPGSRPPAKRPGARRAAGIERAAAAAAVERADQATPSPAPPMPVTAESSAAAPEASGAPRAPASPPPSAARRAGAVLPAVARKPAPPPAAPVAAAALEDPLMAESRSFSAALADWHRDHDADAALAALDSHERRFPDGQIHLEATLLRAEILLKQRREREALALLDGVALIGLPRGRELQTVRGELRIKHGRCAEGRRDLADVLAGGSADELGRRAARTASLCP